MNRISKNQKGFGALEIILIIVVIILIGAVGYLVYKNHHKAVLTKVVTITTTAPANSKGSTTSSDPYAGWKPYELKYEQLSFEYPATWTPTDTSSDGIDDVSFQASDNFNLDIEDGTSTGGDSVILDSHNPLKVKFDGNNDYIVFSHGLAGEPGNSLSGPISSATLLTNTTDQMAYPYDKNVVNVYNSNYDVNGSQLTVSMYYANAKTKQETIKQALVDKEFLNSQLLIQSMHY